MKRLNRIIGVHICILAAILLQSCISYKSGIRNNWNRDKDGVESLPVIDFGRSLPQKTVLVDSINRTKETQKLRDEISQCLAPQKDWKKRQKEFIYQCKKHKHRLSEKELIFCQLPDKQAFNKAETLIYKLLKTYQQAPETPGIIYKYICTLGYYKKNRKTLEWCALLRKHYPDYRRKDMFMLTAVFDEYTCWFSKEMYYDYGIEEIEFDSLKMRIKKIDTALLRYRTDETAYVFANSVSAGKNRELDFTLYKIDPIKMLKEGLSLKSPSLPKHAKLIKTWKYLLKGAEDTSLSFEFDDANHFLPFSSIPCIKSIPEPFAVEVEGYETCRIPIPLTEPGFYLVEMGTKYYNCYTPLLISDVNLLTKDDREILLTYSDFPNNKLSEESTSLTFVKEKQIISEVEMGKNNIFACRTKGQASASFVISRYGKHWGIANIVKPSPFKEKMHFYTYTDRPLYRPGQKVHIKVIPRLFDFKSGSFTILPKKSIKIKVKDSRNDVFKKTELMPDEFGACTLDLQLKKDMPLGKYTVWTICDGSSSRAYFKVDEYRKPDCTLAIRFDHPYAIVGEKTTMTIHGEYYWGAPLAKQKITYYTIVNGKSTKQSAILDEKGNFSTSLDTKKTGAFYPYANAKLPSGRKYDSGYRYYRHHIYPASVKVRLLRNEKRYPEGSAIPVRFITTTLNSKSVSTKVKIKIEWIIDGKGEVIENEIEIETDKKGKGEFAFSPEHPGVCKITATVTDSKKRKANSTKKITVYDNMLSLTNRKISKNVFGKIDKPIFAVNVDASEYFPGSKAKIIIDGESNSGQSLCTVDNMKIESFYLVENKKESEINLPVNPSISAIKLQTYSFLKGIENHKQNYLDMTGNYLDLNMKTGKKIYEPEDKVQLQIEAKDWKRNPVRAQISLAVVDKALLSLATNSKNDIRKGLFKQNRYYIPANRNFIINHFALRNRLCLKRYGGGSRTERAVRKNFKDTGYWNPRLFTSRNGEWEGNFILPDNLTTWQIKTVAVTKDGKAGQGVHEIKTAKDFMLRLVTPRTFTEGDTVTVSGIIHNYNKKSKKCVVTFKHNNGKLISGKQKLTVVAKPDKATKIDWIIHVNKSEPVTISTLAVAEDAADGEERVVPVTPLGITSNFLNGGLFRNTKELKFNLPPDAVPESVKLKVDFQTIPIAASIISGLEYLVDFPYGCVEQTMSRFMPSIIAKKSLKKFNVKNDALDIKLKKCISEGLYKLYGYQHTDGGWGWWKNDATNSFLTAYVIYGLALTKKAGYEVPEYVISAGLKNLEETIPKEQDPQMKAFMIMAYSFFKKAKHKWIDELFNQREKTGNFGIAALLIAVHQSGEKKMIPPLIKLIEKRAIQNNRIVFWQTKGMKLASGTIQSTAFILKALLCTNPDNQLILGAVDYLLQHQKGGRWSTTKDSAAAIEALSLYASKRQNETERPIVSVSVNGIIKKELNLKNTKKTTVTLLSCKRKNLKSGENNINLTCSNNVTYGFSSEFCYRSILDSEKPLDNGLKISRRYFSIPQGRMIYKKKVKRTLLPEKTSVKAGDIIEVELTVRSSHPGSRYLMLEDFFPAGCEVIEKRQSYDGKINDLKYFSKKEIHDDRIIFFCTQMQDKPITITYLLRAETPGEFNVNPCRGELMYHPHINGHSVLTRFNILK